MKKKILIIGHARHGKDTVADFFREYGYKATSSSEAALDIFLFDKLTEKWDFPYKTKEEAFADRVNRRKIWHDEICEYNLHDKTRLAKEIMKDNDIYIGMRSSEEIEQCLKEGVFDIVVGVYSCSKPFEDTSSFDINVFKHSDHLFLNNGSLDWLKEQVSDFIELLKIKYS